MYTVETDRHPLCRRLHDTPKSPPGNARSANGRLMILLAVTCTAVLVDGCTLQEIRSKSKLGPEYRHKGSNRTNSVRWYAQQGFDFIWADCEGNKVTSGITYRRRDVDEGEGDNDNGIWLDFSFPIWKAPSKAQESNARLQVLEDRIAVLESALSDRGQSSSTETPLKGVTP